MTTNKAVFTGGGDKLQGTPVSYLVEKLDFPLRWQSEQAPPEHSSYAHPTQGLTGTHTIDNPGEVGSRGRSFPASIFRSLESHLFPVWGVGFLFISLF